MADDLFRYDLMVETALRGVVRDALRRAAERGLPGNHHFYITFKTRAPGVNIPAYLVERYPDEMTIVLQFQFWDLEILEDQFSVTLSFNDVREPLTIPFEALSGFADPSVQFGLQFQQTASDDAPSGDDDPDSDGPSDDDSDSDDDAGTGEVVSLDQFRKKK
ncbi:MAG: ClpXP protease specificity-enhancing factor SspB [Alphaproteobacteria bacterium]|nr:ClpXP protease specificity-enhancing factor SspB [Alphaproteobacteria bacterium]